jgi:hypothetical protein
MAGRFFRIVEFRHSILVGPPRTFVVRKKELVRPGLVYRARIQRFLDHDGKEQERLLEIEGPVEAVSSVRTAGDMITDYANHVQTSAASLNEDAWYDDVFNDPNLAGLYDKGHLIAAQFGGPTHPLNMAPQLVSANRRSKQDGRWNDMEREIRRMLKAHDETVTGEDGRTLFVPGRGEMRVTLAYDDSPQGSPLIPVSFCLEFRMMGSHLRRQAWNGLLGDLGVIHNKHRKEVVAARNALRRQLARRALRLSWALEDRIQRCSNLVTLKRWHDQAATAASAEAALV